MSHQHFNKNPKSVRKWKEPTDLCDISNDQLTNTHMSLGIRRALMTFTILMYWVSSSELYH